MAKQKIQRSDNPVMWDRNVSTDIFTIKNILATGILNEYQRENRQAQTLAMCAFTQLMVCLKDLLIKASNEGLRLDFKVGDKLDITDLVVKIRDAACHIESKDNLIGNSTFIFNMQTLPDGDIIYSYGQFDIRYHRGVIPLFNDVQKRLIPLTDYPPDFFK